ncbi:MAG: hypothetical protein Q9169_001708 [Polycauliona sp. 2 TL-2023]
MLSSARGNPDGRGIDSTFGVRSLQDSPDHSTDEDGHMGGDREKSEDHERQRSTLRALPDSREHSREQSLLDKGLGSDSPLFGLPRLTSPLPSASVSSLSQDSHGAHPSLPSSPISHKSSSSRSYRASDLDLVHDVASQDKADAGFEVPDNAPQLVFPNIELPSRRPFTERGKNMGRLKILVAGDSGLGKTSLIKVLIQSTEDFVHVDPPKALDLPTASRMNEIWASTKPHPGWRTELEENKLQRRRKSIGETILERNICFVDTPGYGRGLSITEGIDAVISYIEEQVARPFPTGSTSELVDMLSGHGGTQVDVVLYLIGRDTIVSEDLAGVKAAMSKEIDRAGIDCFTMDTDDPIKPPYAVCSSNDDDSMDASLLMDSQYMTPLIPSELSLVVDYLLQVDNASRLKYLAAKKLVQCKTAMKHLPRTTLGSSMGSSHPISSIPTSQTSIPDSTSPPFHPQDRLAEYTRQEEKRAQIRLAKWATDLRRSMQEERRQFEQLQYSERASWLSKKLEECQHDSISLNTEKSIIGTEIATTAIPFGLTKSSNDPLGLLRYDETLRRHGWQIFQIVGTFGLFGAAAWWIAREWSASSPMMMRNGVNEAGSADIQSMMKNKHDTTIGMGGVGWFRFCILHFGNGVEMDAHV